MVFVLRGLRRYWVVGLLLVLGAGGVGALCWLSRRAPPAATSRQPASAPARSEAHRPDRLAGFVGDQVCAGCHSEIAESYSRSGMSHSWQGIDDSPPAGAKALNDVHDPHSSLVYTVVRDGDRFFVTERSAQRSEDPLERRVEARYLVGSGNHAQTLVSETNGYLHQMPVAWFAADGEWRLNPGYESFNHRFERPVPPGCIGCHGTIAEHVEPTRNRYRHPIPDGIGCERCHGPGARHVAHWNGIAAEASAPIQRSTDADPTIVNPGRLPADRGNDICLQCHLQGDVTLYAQGRDPFSFRPGDRLREHRLDLLARTERPEAFGVASHGARLIRSKCFRESDGGLTCFRCHDPHRPVADFQPGVFNARCIECHQPEACGREAPPAEKQEPAGCTVCHMPQRSTREGQHLVFTDHWIRARPVEEPEPEQLAPNADVELVSPWPDHQPDRSRLGSAYVLLHETMGPQFTALGMGVQLLLEESRSPELDEQELYWLGSGLVSLRRSRDAIAVFEQLLQRQPDHLQARFRLAIAYDQLQDYDRAVRLYERLITDDPEWIDPYPLVSRIHLFRRDPDRAIPLLKQQITLLPDATAWANLATARWLEGTPIDECLQDVERALRLDPRSIDALLVQAHFLTVSGRTADAMETYRRILAIDPQNATARAQLEKLERSGTP